MSGYVGIKTPYDVIIARDYIGMFTLDLEIVVCDLYDLRSK